VDELGGVLPESESLTSEAKGTAIKGTAIEAPPRLRWPPSQTHLANYRSVTAIAGPENSRL
jgi:hypothetical protein